MGFTNKLIAQRQKEKLLPARAYPQKKKKDEKREETRKEERRWPTREETRGQSYKSSAHHICPKV